MKDRLFVGRKTHLVCPANITDNPRMSQQSSLSSSCFPLVTGKKSSMDRFLNRFPKAIVKAGRVIDIRESLRATLQVSSVQRRSVPSMLLLNVCSLYYAQHLTSSFTRVHLMPRAATLWSS